MSGRTFGFAILWIVTGSAAASTFAHSGIGWPDLHGQLQQLEAPHDLIGALWAGWFFGSVAFAVYALLLGSAILRLMRGDRQAFWEIVIIGGGFLAFGLIGFVVRDYQLHFLAFVGAGTLTWIGAGLAQQSPR